MKHLIATAVIVLFLFSCQKEMNVSTSNYSNNSNQFFENAKEKLRDSLSASDYASIDINQLFKSKDAQSDGYFVRVAFQNKNIAIDFILLKTDSLGNVRQGKIIHVKKTNDKSTTKSLSFQGQFIISTLNRKNEITKEVINGRWKNQSGTTSLLEEEPAGEQTLPDCVVTYYTPTGGVSTDWYWYGGFYDDYGGVSSGSTYTYGYAGGGGSSNSDGASTNNDNTLNIEVEPNDEGPIKVEDYTKCFSNVPDANATYQITLYADIPVNGDPSELFNTSTGQVGHSFIQLSKSSGGTSVQQNIGFYPETGWKSLSDYSVASKVVDNAGHEFNSSLTMSVSSTEFSQAITQIQTLADRDYNISTWNCTDFALSVFNAANTGEPLTIPQYMIPGTNTYANTPQGLYATMEGMKNIGNDSYGQINVPGICRYVGDSHGSCGN